MKLGTFVTNGMGTVNKVKKHIRSHQATIKSGKEKPREDPLQEGDSPGHSHQGRKTAAPLTDEPKRPGAHPKPSHAKTITAPDNFVAKALIIIVDITALPLLRGHALAKDDVRVASCRPICYIWVGRNEKAS